MNTFAQRGASRPDALLDRGVHPARACTPRRHRPIKRLACNRDWRCAIGRYEDALALYDAALAVQCSDEGAEVVHANRSAALHALGQLKQALAAGLEATSIAPKYAKGHLRVANGESQRTPPQHWTGL